MLLDKQDQWNIDGLLMNNTFMNEYSSKGMNIHQKEM
jgi:hypothetical protein